jgi:bifunctional non-homologous end joining protein LigD
MLLKSDEPNRVLTNLKKVFWPDEGYTKRDLLDYYREIAPVILLCAKDRSPTASPRSNHRHGHSNDTITKPCWPRNGLHVDMKGGPLKPWKRKHFRAPGLPCTPAVCLLIYHCLPVRRSTSFAPP